MKKKLAVLSGLVMGLSPVAVLAQGVVTTGSGSTCAADAGTLLTVLCKIGQLFNTLVPILIALGVLYFVWGVVNYVIANDEEAKKAGRDRMIYGIIGLAVIISVWGLAKILTRTFGVSNNETITLPTIPLGTR